jgi:hypothetical protein
MPPTTPQRRGPTRTLAIVAGALAVFLAVGLLIAGGVVLWADSRKDAAGYLSTASERISTDSYAVATDDLNVKIDAPGWVVNRDHYGRIRLQVSPRAGKPLFVGIAPTRAVSTYLGRTAHESLTDVSFSPFVASYRFADGERPPGAPTAQRFWAASAHGPGRQTVTWDVKQGSWTVVVMNADGSPGVDAGVSAGARLPFLQAVGWGSAGTGLFLLVAAGGLMFAGLRAPRRAPSRPGALDPQPAAT